MIIDWKYIWPLFLTTFYSIISSSNTLYQLKVSLSLHWHHP